MNTRKILQLLVFGLGSLLCLGACQTEKVTTANDAARQRDWIKAAIMDDLARSRPWAKLPRTSTDNVRDSQVVSQELEDQRYKPGIDQPDDLLGRAEKGDMRALSKVESYIIEANPNWDRRFEMLRLQARVTGIAGIGRYYCAVREAGLRAKSREVDRAIKNLELEAEAGGWQQAVALYQLYGFLFLHDCRTPFGDNLTRSGRWLRVVYQRGGREVFDNVVRREKLRMGWIHEVDRVSYPHTPKGWKPE